MPGGPRGEAKAGQVLPWRRGPCLVFSVQQTLWSLRVQVSSWSFGSSAGVPRVGNPLDSVLQEISPLLEATLAPCSLGYLRTCQEVSETTR